MLRTKNQIYEEKTAEMLHVWYSYLHLPYIYIANVGKYPNPMDPMEKFLGILESLRG